MTAPPNSPQKLPASSAELTAELLAALREQVPHVFTESGIDFDKLKAALGGAVADGKERYGLTWAGKMEAFRNVQSVSNGTLAPMPHDSVNWDGTGNLIIEGDNLEVLKLLQRPYHGKVKMIYIDPPYNTGNEFIYPDNFREGLQDYLRYSGQISEEGFAQSANKDSNGRYHSNWLNMLYPRLFLARNLLREDGVIFVSIDDHEVHNLRHLMDEVFGEENFVASVVWEKVYTTKNDDAHLSSSHEYVVCFARNLAGASLGLLARSAEMDARYKNPDKDERGPWKAIPLYADGERKNGRYVITAPNGAPHTPRANMHWRYRQEDMAVLLNDNRIYFGADGSGQPNLKRFLSEVNAGVKARTLWSHSEVGSNDSAKRESRSLFGEEAPFPYPKPSTLVARMLELSSKPDDFDDEHIILDFFAGSGTTAHAVLELNAKDGGNRKFILVQLPEKTDNPNFPTIADITRERVRRVIAKLESAAAEKTGADRQSSMALGGSTPVVKVEPDLGFRAFRLAASNFRVWDAGNAGDPHALAQQIALHADNVNGAASSGALVYELMLRAGLPPSVQVERVGIAAGGGACEAFAVDGDALLVCVENAVTPALMRAMIARKPKKLVCLDKAFAGDDAAKTNALLEAASHDVMFYTA